MLEHLRTEDVRFTSPRLAVLQGLYRFGTGPGTNLSDVRGMIAHCLAEVLQHHATLMRYTVETIREQCYDPSSIAKTARGPLAHLSCQRDRGQAQLLELLEFAVLCENREVMILYSAQLGDAAPFRSARRPERAATKARATLAAQVMSTCKLFSTDTAEAAVERKYLESRMTSLLHASCAAVKALADDEFFDPQVSNPREDSSRGYLESETANLLLHIQSVIFNVAHAVNAECSKRLSTWQLGYLLRTWPRGEQCNPALVYIRSMYIGLQFLPPSAVGFGRERASPFRMQPRRPLVERCLLKLLQAVHSHHMKVCHSALHLLSSALVQNLLLHEDRTHHEQLSDQMDPAASVISLTSANMLPPPLSRECEESIMEQLVSILRHNRDSHWHPQIQNASSALLQELTDLMLTES